MKYDYLIVGAGLYGAAFAQQMTAAGKRCLVIDRRPHLAGNAHCQEVEGILVHVYGAHIFHTADEEVWEYVNRYVRFNHYVNSPVAIYHNELYNLPFNMNTFSKLWGVLTPGEAQAEIQRQASRHAIDEPQNLEEQALKLVGDDIYQKLIKGYTEKQWGRDCKDLPAFILRRVPLRFTYDNNYFTDPHQGIPTEGYDVLVQRLLAGSDVLLSTCYRDFVEKHPHIAHKTVYTGTIDGFFGYCYGPLEYRSLRFETETLDMANYQGNAVVNYTDAGVPFTRVIEHKHFEMFGDEVYQCPKTVISREYSTEWRDGMEPYYPVNDKRNNGIYLQYKALADAQRHTIFGGRLAEYKYYDMAPIVERVLATEV